MRRNPVMLSENIDIPRHRQGSRRNHDCGRIGINGEQNERTNGDKQRVQHEFAKAEPARNDDPLRRF